MKRSFAVTFLYLLAVPALAEPALTLEHYLAQVKATGPSYLASITTRKDNDLSRLLLGKRWYANATFGLSGNGSYYNRESYDYLSGQYQYFDRELTEQIGYNGGLSLSNQWDFGLTTSFNGNYSYTHSWPMYTVPYAVNPYTSSSDNYSLNVAIPLWRNFLGRQIHALNQQDFLNNDASAATQEFQIQGALFNAKSFYFSLASVRTEMEAAREALQKYRELLDWAKAHRSPHDVLQAQASLENLELTNESLEDSERTIRNSFNMLRGVEGSSVEDIQSLDELNRSAKAEWVSQEPDRLDLKAARIQLESAKNSLIYAEENTKLDVELQGGIGGGLFYTGGYPAPPPLTYPTVDNYSASLSLNIPFDIFTSLWDANYKIGKLNLAQQEVNLRSTENNDSRQWEDMTIRFNKSADRIATSNDLVEISREKRDQGEALFKKGRVDIYEMLVFVGTYYTAVVSRQNWLSQRLSLLAQAEWYRAEPGSWKKEQAFLTP